jgi:hypothetical protein
VTALLAGCPPPSYGIFRSATIEAAPDLACVRGLLEGSGAASIEFYDYAGGRRVTWRGLPASTLGDIRVHLQAVDRGVQDECGVRVLAVTEEECRGRNCSGA